MNDTTEFTAEELLDMASEFEVINQDGQRLKVIRLNRAAVPVWRVYGRNGPTYAANHFGEWRCLLHKDFESFVAEFNFDSLGEAIQLARSTGSIQSQLNKKAG